MNTTQNLILTTSIAALFAVAPVTHAATVQFDITAVSFSVGSGYGVDPNENGNGNNNNSGTLLDVFFSNTVFLNTVSSPLSFQLSTINASHTFDFGTVDFRESRINDDELDGLGVTANFTFSNPLGAVKNLAATGNAFAGTNNDSESDYTLTWAPIDVDFGIAGGQFRLSMNPLDFKDNGLMKQTATITLLTLPTESGNGGASINAVPEPGSIALVGLGLLGLAALRRRQIKR